MNIQNFLNSLLYGHILILYQPLEMLAVIRSRNIFRNRILNEIKNSVVHNSTALENHISRRSHDICTSGYRKAVVSCMFRGSIGAACTYQAVSYTHLRAHETKANLVCRLL